MVSLRSYQKDAIEAIRKGFENGSRQYVEMPTGAGKTITFLSYAKQFHKNILIIVPSRELLKQVYESALLFFSKDQISRRGSAFRENAKQVHICIIYSIRGDYLNRLAQCQFDLTIIDEAHHVQADSYRKLITEREKFFEKGEMKILGVTATPDRVDGQFIEELLHDCSFKLTIQELIEQKHLSDIEGFSVKTDIDISDVECRNGDFSIRGLYKKLQKTSRDQLLVDVIKEHMRDRKTLVFCINVQHSLHLNKLLNDSGLSSEHIDGSMPMTQRNSILAAFRNGDIDILCNCQILTEGFDEPSIDGIVLARPTRSRSLFIQMVGRGLRNFKGKSNCKIVDMVDNHRLIAGFNSLIVHDFLPQLDTFRGISSLNNHVQTQLAKVIHHSIERIDIFGKNFIADSFPLDSMVHYLQSNSIYYDKEITFDEASFLIWMNELKKEHQNGMLH